MTTHGASPRLWRLDALVSGVVQGVGYRYFALRAARGLRLTGYTRNLADGTVEVVAEGRRSALDALLRQLEQGPPDAQVTGIEQRWSALDAPAFDTFKIRR